MEESFSLSQETLKTPEFSVRYDKYTFHIVNDNERGNDTGEISCFADFILMQKMSALQIDLMMPNLKEIEEEDDVMKD